ncbi:4431_t:CDS:2 [Ambispora leptoticha]|uniref:4431_t:CDS:1 n=1 Tax=Ambispora leptoticha TaxID=144679 RepID=A0A9N9CEV2_9GLOM|nr:4431_t:CDS:2 [Ambispora leptoticha]
MNKKYNNHSKVKLWAMISFVLLAAALVVTVCDAAAPTTSPSTNAGNTGTSAVNTNSNNVAPSQTSSANGLSQKATPTNNVATASNGNNAASATDKGAPVTATLPSPTNPTQITADSNNPLPSLPANPYAGANGTMTWQQCVDYGKYCRDVLCAFQNYTATCQGAGGCTCVGPIYSKADRIVPIQNAVRAYTAPVLFISIVSHIFGLLY